MEKGSVSDDVHMWHDGDMRVHVWTVRTSEREGGRGMEGEDDRGKGFICAKEGIGIDGT